MEENQKDYNGIWKQIGCVLSVIVILAIVAVFVIGTYLLVQGF